ncbi:AraC family transcriptional regulator [Paenibacillus humicus]|uniref:AraC family transcriptional regulator n=1 Tax=Paenibacillus humicus TaxID=412861 RepID=UPI0013E3EFD4|nr:AraC family transcriptional regulator [Paenibacillus humicus]
MPFSRLILETPVQVESLISFHYFEYPTGFLFEGESHDFWELLYVDKGEVEVRADDRLLTLKQGQLIFHKPGEFHTVRVDAGHRPPNLIVIAFGCTSPLMQELENRVSYPGERERSWLALLLQEGFASFLPPYHTPGSHELSRNPQAPAASQQSFRLLLELLLIGQIRSARSEALGEQAEQRRSVPAKAARLEQDTVRRVREIMRQRLSEPLALDDLCRAVHLGRSRLKEIFLSQTGMGVMDAFKEMKIEEAKTLIRERRHTYTEIADRLGYSSLHYFSRDFKKATGMPPSEYSRTVTAAASLPSDSRR